MKSRRRSTPWIHRWSRQIIGAIAVLGALLTAYLTFVKLTGGTTACLAGAAGSSSCNDVLSSSYATVFGIPLSLFGFLAYTSMAAFALAPLAMNSDEKKQLRSNLENWTWLLLFAGATAMTIFSGYLMYLLFFTIKASCPYCYASALFSLSLFVLTLIGHTWEDFGQLFFTGIIVAMIALIGTIGIYSGIRSSSPSGKTPIPAISGDPQPGVGWEITTTSGSDEIELARHLKKTGAKMYGAFWCPHCHEQKLLLGKEAVKEMTYIECADSQNFRQQTAICRTAGIESYPTWEVNGKLYPGIQEPQKLAELSGYQGSTNFKYSLSGR